MLELVTLELDELEAIRLADYQGLYHEDAAKQMGVSRQTFGRIIEQARAKVAKAIILGMALKIDTGNTAGENYNCPDLEPSENHI